MTDHAAPVLGNLGLARLIRNYSTYSILVAAIVSMWAWAGWGFPLVMAKDYEHDLQETNNRLAKIETAVGALSIGQMESQELTLLARVQDLERELAKTAEEPLRVILMRQKNEAEQALEKIRSALATARSTNR